MKILTSNENINKYLSIENPKWYQKLWFFIYMMYLDFIKREDIFIGYKNGEEKESEIIICPYIPTTCKKYQDIAKEKGIPLYEECKNDRCEY